MKHLLGGVMIIFLFAQTSVEVFAVVSSSTSQLYEEGPSEPVRMRYRRVRGSGSSSDWQQKINALGDTAETAVTMPVLFGVGIKNIFPNFGDPRSGGRTHEGEDIMAVKGTPIVSPTPAVVLRVGVGATEGNYVYTANPGSETFVYMHLDRIGEGIVSGLALGRGALLGYVGNTGNASGGPAHLHFEIHDRSGAPVDPFPRLTAEFSLSEKISYLSTILTQTADSRTLAQFLVSNFRQTFKDALVANIVLPLPIASFMVATETTVATGLAIGSSGPAIVTLQKYLIQAAAGLAAARLKSAGATGYFGLITKAALTEYETAFGVLISPTSPTPIPTTATIRNLSQGVTGEDVRELQRLLNRSGYPLAVNGPGSAGQETTYFGPITRVAVIKFQTAKGLTPTGVVELITRGYLNGCLAPVGYSPLTGQACALLLLPGCTANAGYSTTTGHACGTTIKRGKLFGWTF